MATKFAFSTAPLTKSEFDLLGYAVRKGGLEPEQGQYLSEHPAEARAFIENGYRLGERKLGDV